MSRDQVIGKFASRQTDYRKLRQRLCPHPAADDVFPRKILEGSWARSTHHSILQWIMTCGCASPRAPIQICMPGKTWANFRIHTSSKTNVNDERGWKEMLRVHYRDGGSFFSVDRGKILFEKD
jgi:hypothetical protein